VFLLTFAYMQNQQSAFSYSAAALYDYLWALASAS